MKTFWHKGTYVGDFRALHKLLCLPHQYSIQYVYSTCIVVTRVVQYTQQHNKFLLHHSKPSIAPPKLKPFYPVLRKVRCSCCYFPLQNCIKLFQKKSLNVLSVRLHHFGLEKICSLAKMHKLNGLHSSIGKPGW